MKGITRLNLPVRNGTNSETVRAEGFGNHGQTAVISAGMPFGTPGTTNLLRIAQIQ